MITSKLSPRPRPVRHYAAVAGLCAGTLLAACGDDAEAASVCQPYVDVTRQFNSEEPDPAAVGPLLDQLEAEMPDDLDDSLPVMIAAARQAAQGDFSGFESPAFGEAQSEVDAWMFDECDYDQTEEVSAKDFAFEGLADEYDAGQLAVLFTNEGQEAHELMIMKKAAGVTQSWDEILALPEEEGQAMVEQFGGAFAPSNGSTGLALLDLPAGDYIAVCFVPTGTTIDDEGFHEGTGVPHFMAGMRHEFTVTA